MYSPTYFRESREEIIHTLIERDGFATLLTPGGEGISHLPMIVEPAADGTWSLLCHMARANPHWQELEKAGRAKAIFHGPHAYVSPAWYTPNPGNVPTWNYAVVHVTGDFELIGEPALAEPAMRKLVEKFEDKYGTGWSLPENEVAVQKLMAHIVVFRIKNPMVEGKLKLSQQQSAVNRENVITELAKIAGDPTDVAALMRQTKLAPKN